MDGTLPIRGGSISGFELATSGDQDLSYLSHDEDCAGVTLEARSLDYFVRRRGAQSHLSKQLLDRVSLRAGPGEIVAIMGEDRDGTSACAIPHEL